MAILTKNLDLKLNVSGLIEPGKDYIPVTGKIIEEDDLLHGIEAMTNGWLTVGRFANQFEKDFAVYFNAPKCLLVIPVHLQIWLLLRAYFF